MSKELEVKNLQISFRTDDGTVKAVRDISFDLEKGETLCIVGESGSGKSVTAKAVMGILAGNSIVEGGEILYNGKNLLNYTEKEFDKIRGNRITMIFQDPLSSLDPIVKIGRQMTEATLLNGKTNCREAKREFRKTLSLLKKNMKAAGCAQDAFQKLERCMEYIKKGSSLKYTYRLARDYTQLAAADAEALLITLYKDDVKLVKEELKYLDEKLARICDEYWLGEKVLRQEPFSGFRREMKQYDGSDANKEALKKSIELLLSFLKQQEERKEPDFTAVAYSLSGNAAKDGFSQTDASAEEKQNEALASVYEAEFKHAFLKTLSEAGEDADGCYEKLEQLAFEAVNKVTKQTAYDKAIRIMEDVGIKEARKRFDQYPFEFSGGMRQRIVIAIAIAANPDILICDEPTTALDVTIQAQIMELINEIKEKRRLSVIFITHDLGVVANMADKVAVMYAGKIVEYGTTDDIFYEPTHPYTWALLASMPDLDTKDKLEAIPGTPPNMIYPPVGDAFAERNKYAMPIDFEKQPPLFRISETHYAATWLLHPNAPKIDPPKSVTDRIKRMKELEAAANE
jgi:oligopeptide/dipeptide ABC transporter ATP-binding protein